MVDNPYQSPQSPSKAPLLAAWRRHLSNLLVILGSIGSLCLILIAVATVIQLLVLRGEAGVHTDEYAIHKNEQLREVLVAGIQGLAGPGFLLAGLAIRRLLRWRIACAITLALTIVFSMYFLWWWSQVRNELKHTVQQPVGLVLSGVSISQL